MDLDVGELRGWFGMTGQRKQPTTVEPASDCWSWHRATADVVEALNRICAAADQRALTIRLLYQFAAGWAW